MSASNSSSFNATPLSEGFKNPPSLGKYHFLKSIHGTPCVTVTNRFLPKCKAYVPSRALIS